MLRRIFPGSLVLGLFPAAIAVAEPATVAPAYAAEIAAARAERQQHLTAPDGWLTLIGLHFLRPGANPVGSAPTNTIVIPKAPAQLGTLTLAEDGRVTITLNPAAGARIDGRERLSGRLDEQGAEPPRVTWGSLTLFVIERGGRQAVRVKDSEAVTRVQFRGLDYFPVDPSWRIEAAWVPFEPAREVKFQNILGQESTALVPGKAVFTRDARTFELLPLVESPDEPLLFVFSDQTSGDETYAAARFVSAEPPRDGRLILDFNLAVNPPCAFSTFATCPLPPPQNRLPIPVRAGEKKYRGSAEHADRQ
jgi:uncharacterized protein (DUF1684 family)